MTSKPASKWAETIFGKILWEIDLDNPAYL